MVGLFGLDVDQGEVGFRRSRVQLFVVAFHLTAGAVEDDSNVADGSTAQNQALSDKLQTVPQAKKMRKKCDLEKIRK